MSVGVGYPLERNSTVETIEQEESESDLGAAMFTTTTLIDERHFHA